MDSSLITKIRGMILNGVLAPGTRVTEIGLAEQLNVSRTPVRNALPALAKEGLLQPVGKRGFAVSAFSRRESFDALHLRSVIEGTAAATVAREGATPALTQLMTQCLARGDAIFAKRCLRVEDEAEYAEMNDQFHAGIVAAAASTLLSDIYERVKLVPFAAPQTIAFDKVGLDKAYDILFCAHQQHHAIADAILSGDGARAEFLFREHAQTQKSGMLANDGSD